MVVAGAGGGLGERIVRALVGRGASVRALVRPGLAAEERARMEAMGASVAAACAGTGCVVSALSGLRPVMIGRQSVLLDAAVEAAVPRFIPSDFSADFTRTPPGGKRNLDLRREFIARADQAPIRVTSVLNDAFKDMLGAEIWMVSTGQGAMALGPLCGGWRIVRPVGSRITHLTPMQGFCAETGGALALRAAWLGIPVLATHTPATSP